MKKSIKIYLSIFILSISTISLNLETYGQDAGLAPDGIDLYRARQVILYTQDGDILGQNCTICDPNSACFVLSCRPVFFT